MSNIHVISGDAYLLTRRLTVTVTDENAAALDLTGTSLTFVVKARRDGTALITKETPTDIELASPQTGATKGVAYIALEETDTDDLDGRYRWELEGDDAIGKITLAAGGFYVTPDLIG